MHRVVQRQIYEIGNMLPSATCGSPMNIVKGKLICEIEVELITPILISHKSNRFLLNNIDKMIIF